MPPIKLTGASLATDPTPWPTADPDTHTLADKDLNAKLELRRRRLIVVTTLPRNNRLRPGGAPLNVPDIPPSLLTRPDCP